MDSEGINARDLCEKMELLEKLKKKGLFWSYSSSLAYRPELDGLLIETVLKYGDYSDIKKVFSLYDRNILEKAWLEKMAGDERFRKVNYFLARMFFGMKVEADYFSGGMHEREKKLRLLAT